MNSAALPAPPAPWQARRLLSAPHRLGFATGAALMSALALWWLLAMAAPRLGIELRWALPPTQAHGLLFTLGFICLLYTSDAADE